MAVLDAAQLHALPKSAFGLPAQRKFPMPDAAHAKDALARASQGVNDGRLSGPQAAQIRAKAHAILAKGNALGPMMRTR